MDFLTEKFIAFSRHLRDELSGLRESIDALRDQQERQHQEQQAEHRAEHPLPIGIRGDVNAEIHETKAAQRENRSRHNRNFWVQVALAIGTWLAFAAAAYYAGVAKKQLKQMTIATRQTGIAADAATKQAIIAKSTFAATIEQFHLDQRAWVAVDEVIPPILKATEPLNVIINFKNTGKTPAKNFLIYARGEFVDKGKKPKLPAERLPGKGVIPPNGVFHTTLGDLTKPQVDADVMFLSSGLRVIWLHGKVTYDDVFDRAHWTTYCYVFIPKERTKDFGQGGFAPCETGNDVGDGDGPNN